MMPGWFLRRSVRRPPSGPGIEAALRPRPETQALAAQLPYLSCGSYAGFAPLHLLCDDTLGYAFECALPTVDTEPEGEEEAARAVLGMLHAVAPGVQWQWFLHADACVEPQLARYERQAGADAAGRLFADAFIERWRMAQDHGFFPAEEELNFHPRSLRLIVALKSAPIGFARPALGASLPALLPARVLARIPHAVLARNQESRVRRAARGFIACIRDVLAATQALGWSTHALDGAGLVAYVGGLLFPQRQRAAEAAGGSCPPPRLPAEGVEEIRAAVAAMGRIEDISPRGFCTRARGRRAHHRVVSMLWQPRAVAAGMLNAIVHLRPRLGVCVCAAPLPPNAALLQLKARALLNARSTHRFNETEMQARKQALDEVEHRLFAEGERIFSLRVQVHVIEEEEEEAERAAAQVCKHLEALEIEAAVEEDIGSTLLLRGCLPFAIYSETEQKLRRRRRMLSRDCADLHPAGACWTGVAAEPEGAHDSARAAAVMYCNPVGEPLFIDPTKAEKNPHALVIGQSGSGKSFFVHDYLLHLWRLPDVRLFLISIKADYRKLALLLGRYVEITLDSEVSLNPFSGRPTLENQARWFAALCLMLGEGQAETSLPREAEVALQGAALAAAQRNWDAERQCPLRETTLEHICQELERTAGPLGRQLALRLQPYRRGPYRKLFNAPRGVHSSDRFVFFNLGSILRQPCAALVSFCVFGMVDEVMNDPALRAVPKGLIADEVWALVRNAHAAAILERSLKAYRSLGGFALPIVQDPQDLDTPSGRVMLVNTATKVILPLDRAGQNELTRYVRLNERELEIVRDLRLVKRRYSEFFVSIDGMRSAKGLLIPDPLRYAIATTDPVDESEIERIFRDCGNMLEAVRRFAHERPYGIAAHATAAIA